MYGYSSLMQNWFDDFEDQYQFGNQFYYSDFWLLSSQNKNHFQDRGLM